MSAPKKDRVDRLLVTRGLVPSRERAQALLLAGAVEVDGMRVSKAGQLVSADAALRIVDSPLRYVSRGGLKLEAAIDHFGIPVAGRVAVDVGASTGGFTDCLLQRGARRVFAVDVGYGQLALHLRNDPRIVVMERCNVRYLAPEALDETPDLATIDVSFISLRIVLPAVVGLMAGVDMEIVALVKPQFEVGRKEVGKGGVVRAPALHERVLQEISSFGREMGLEVSAPFLSPIRGPKGNQEFFLHLTGAGRALQGTPGPHEGPPFFSQRSSGKRSR
jgi:23S rRNA (cytidine1920-2'-O)/16S rRNA (cytidine1409-2'-O)-methyltransferase